MAYLRELDTTCYAMACGKRAVIEVYNNYNASCGRYCRPHGKRRLAELESIEADAS
jgi:hypothetical protein